MNFKFDMSEKINGVRTNILSGIGQMIGTTFSGDTLGTTLFGTMRNWFYHMYAIQKNLHNFSFFPLLLNLPTKHHREGDRVV